MNKKLKLSFLAGAIAIVCIAIVIFGISYSGFNFNFKGENSVINSQCFKTSLSDNGSVSIDKAVPLSDNEGLKLEPYTYTIENNCDQDISYFVTLNVLEGTNLDNLSKVKVSLSGDSKLDPTLESSLIEVQLVEGNNKDIVKAYRLDDGTLKKDEKKIFHLRTWIDHNVTSISGKVVNKIAVKQFNS